MTFNEFIDICYNYSLSRSFHIVRYEGIPIAIIKPEYIHTDSNWIVKLIDFDDDLVVVQERKEILYFVVKKIKMVKEKLNNRKLLNIENDFKPV